MLKNGQPAPAFTLKCQDGTDHSLSEWAGKPLVMLFFRGAFCPTTKRSLTVWQDFAGAAKGLGVSLVGISSDTVENHAMLYQKYDVSFPLLSDTDMTVSEQYGIYPDTYNGIAYGEPALVIVDATGNVAYFSISSGPKGLPDPGAVAGILIYMSTHDGKY